MGVGAIAAATDLGHIFVGTDDGGIQIATASDNTIEPSGSRIAAHTAPIVALATADREGRLLVSGSSDGIVKIWRVTPDGLETVNQFSVPAIRFDGGDKINDVAISSDGIGIVTGGRLISASLLLPPPVRDWNHDSMVVSSSGQLFATLDKANHRLSLFDSVGGRSLQSHDSFRGCEPQAVAMAPGGEALVVGVRSQSLSSC